MPLGANITSIENIVGDKRYELSNHLGNVLSVITDRRVGNALANAEVVAYNDYYPFGMLMPNRHGNSEIIDMGLMAMEGR